MHQTPLQQALLRYVLQEANMPSVVNASPLILLSLLLRYCRSFLMRDGNFVFSSIRVVVSSFETSWNSSWGTLIRSLASWKYINLSIASRFSLLFKGIFARCRWGITKLLRKSRCHLQWPSRTHTWQSHRFSCNHPRLPPYFLIFWPTPYFSLLRRSFCLSDRSCISCLTAFTFSVVQGDTVWIHHLYYKKQICILLNSTGVELQLIDLWVRK